MKKNKKNNKEKIYRSKGNVFADLGLKDSKRTFARAQVMARITAILQERGLTQKEAAEILGIPQSKVSCLMNGKLSMFSLDHLFQLLNALDQDVRIIIEKKKKWDKSASIKVA